MGVILVGGFDRERDDVCEPRFEIVLAQGDGEVTGDGEFASVGCFVEEKDQIDCRKLVQTFILRKAMNQSGSLRVDKQQEYSPEKERRSGRDRERGIDEVDSRKSTQLETELHLDLRG